MGGAALTRQPVREANRLLPRVMPLCLDEIMAVTYTRVDLVRPGNSKGYTDSVTFLLFIFIFPCTKPDERRPASRDTKTNNNP